MNNNQRYWHINCPICQQGRVFVEVHEKTGDLFLECEECSSAWNTPDLISEDKNGFLAIDIESHFATAEEIQKFGWSRYRFKIAITIDR